MVAARDKENFEDNTERKASSFSVEAFGKTKNKLSSLVKFLWIGNSGNKKEEEEEEEEFKKRRIKKK